MNPQDPQKPDVAYNNLQFQPQVYQNTNQPTYQNLQQPPQYFMHPGGVMMPMMAQGFMFQGIPMGFVSDPMTELANAKSAKIKQKIELLEIFTGCETKNRYHVYIKNHLGQDIYLFKCKEDSSWFCRNCCSSSAREFRMNVKHVSGVNDFSGDDYSNKFAEFSRPFKCTCCCMARPQMTGFLSHNKSYVGKVVDPFTCCDASYNVYNTHNELRWRVRGDCCQCGLLCRDSCGACSEAVFHIFDARTKANQTQSAGKVIKRFSGFKELISDANVFEIFFPNEATPEEKLMLIGATLMIDYEYFESTGQNQGYY